MGTATPIFIPTSTTIRAVVDPPPQPQPHRRPPRSLSPTQHIIELPTYLLKPYSIRYTNAETNKSYTKKWTLLRYLNDFARLRGLSFERQVDLPRSTAPNHPLSSQLIFTSPIETAGQLAPHDTSFALRILRAISRSTQRAKQPGPASKIPRLGIPPYTALPPYKILVAQPNSTVPTELDGFTVALAVLPASKPPEEDIAHNIYLPANARYSNIFNTEFQLLERARERAHRSPSSTSS